MTGAATTLSVAPAREAAGSRGALWLRASSTVALLFAGGHTLGGLKGWTPAASPALDVMRRSSFGVEGVSRTYFDFYRGFGFSLCVYMLLQAFVLWQLAKATQSNAPPVRPIVAAFALASLANTVIAWAFIMPVPAAFSAVLTACIGAALVSG